jgi:hypothetical protein
LLCEEVKWRESRCELWSARLVRSFQAAGELNMMTMMVACPSSLFSD